MTVNDARQLRLPHPVTSDEKSLQFTAITFAAYQESKTNVNS